MIKIGVLKFLYLRFTFCTPSYTRQGVQTHPPNQNFQWTHWFDPLLRRTFFLVYFFLLPLQEHARKVVGGFGKKNCVGSSVRKPGNTCDSLTAML